jgi:hypothetical protein
MNETKCLRWLWQTSVVWNTRLDSCLTIAYEATVKVLTIKSNLGFDYEYMSVYIPEDTKKRID